MFIDLDVLVLSLAAYAFLQRAGRCEGKFDLVLRQEPGEARLLAGVINGKYKAMMGNVKVSIKKGKERARDQDTRPDAVGARCRGIEEGKSR